MGNSDPDSPRRGGEGAGGVQSVDRAISVLEILARNGGAGVSEVAADIGVHKSTAFRLLAALEERGLVEQNHDRGRYQLGFGILRLGGAPPRGGGAPPPPPPRPGAAGPAGARRARRFARRDGQPRRAPRALRRQ